MPSEERHAGWKHGQVAWGRSHTGEPRVQVIQLNTIVDTDADGAITLIKALLEVLHPGQDRLDAPEDPALDAMSRDELLVEVQRARETTTDGRDPDEVRAEQAVEGNVLHKSYVVLSPEERAKGFIRPVRRSYKHVGPTGPKHFFRELIPEEQQRYRGLGYVKFEEYPGPCATSPGCPCGRDHGSATGRFWTQAQLDAVGKGCGEVTTMGLALAETYARKPDFYGSTFCATCGKHFPVGEAGEFVWDGSEERVGT